MAVESRLIQSLSQNVSRVVFGGNVFNLDRSSKDKLPNLEESAIHMARAVALLAVTRLLDSALVVNVDSFRLRLGQTHLL